MLAAQFTLSARFEKSRYLSIHMLVAQFTLSASFEKSRYLSIHMFAI